MRLLTEFIGLCNTLEQVQLRPGVPDTFAWRLMADQQYSASSAHGAMFVGCPRPLGAKQLWKTATPQRVKSFFWLVMHDRCWTTHRRWRHGLQESNICIICDQAVETMDHIILGCVFSREVWASCLRRFRLQDRVLVQESDIMQWWTDSRRCLPKSIRRGFDSLFFLVGWTLWKCENLQWDAKVGGAAASSHWYRHLGRAGLASSDGWRMFVVLIEYYIYCVITTVCESGDGKGNGNLWIPVLGR